MNQQDLLQHLFTEATFPKKVKMTLRQPEIICSGRDRVTAFFRGVATSKRILEGVSGSTEVIVIDFRYKGTQMLAHLKNNGKFVESQLADLQLCTNK